MLDRFFYLVLLLLLTVSCKNDKSKTNINNQEIETINDSLIYPEETHFKSLRQITFGGDNAEAYWSFDDQQIIFQSNNTEWGVGCDQMFLMQRDEVFDTKQPPLISTGLGRTTCAYFLPDNTHFIYASTHEGSEECPETPLRIEGRYVWPVYDSFDIYKADLQGNIISKLTDSPGYDAEATLSPQGDKIVFTSDRSGDL